jgi:hypothetical protein
MQRSTDIVGAGTAAVITRNAKPVLRRLDFPSLLIPHATWHGVNSNNPRLFTLTLLPTRPASER